MPFERAGPVVSIGECMVELARGPDGRFGLAFGGDTFNTAVYLARAGLDVAYATAIGDDPYSAGIRRLASEEAVDTRLIAELPGRNAGLYLIETNDRGERTFWYWRERAPARELFEDSVAEAHRHDVEAACQAAAIVYFSGITLSIYAERGLERFAACLLAARRAGATIVMDGNYRPRNFGGDVARARRTFERFWRLADVALPTFDDEQALWGDRSPVETAARLLAFGVSEIAIKGGADGAWLAAGGAATGDAHGLGLLHVPCPARVAAVVDTTAAGDSFNAGYLAARLRRHGREAAALSGHRLAAVVIAHRGAIVPRAATDVAMGALG